MIKVRPAVSAILNQLIINMEIIIIILDEEKDTIIMIDKKRRKKIFIKNRFVNNVKIFFILFILLCNVCTCSSYSDTTGNIVIDGFILNEQDLPISGARVEFIKISGSNILSEASLKNHNESNRDNFTSKDDGYYEIRYAYNLGTETSIFGDKKIVEYVDYAEIKCSKDGYKDKIESFDIIYDDDSGDFSGDFINRNIILLKAE